MTIAELAARDQAIFSAGFLYGKHNPQAREPYAEFLKESTTHGTTERNRSDAG